SITYYFAPNLTVRQWHWITPGAVVGIVLLVIVSAGLRLYLSHFPTYNATYGSLGAVISLLLYFYMSGAAVLSGAALNGVLQHRSSTKASPARRDLSPQAKSLRAS